MPDKGYWSEIWLKQPVATYNFFGRPVQYQFYSMFYQVGADWNGTRFADREFDNLMIAARGETDQVKRKALYAQMSHILWKEGCVFIQVFTDLINAHADRVIGWKTRPNDELMGGFTRIPDRMRLMQQKRLISPVSL